MIIPATLSAPQQNIATLSAPQQNIVTLSAPQQNSATPSAPQQNIVTLSASRTSMCQRTSRRAKRINDGSARPFARQLEHSANLYAFALRVTALAKVKPGRAVRSRPVGQGDRRRLGFVDTRHTTRDT